MVFLLKSPYSVRPPAFVFLGFFKEKARAPRKLFQFFSHFLSTTRDSTTSHRKTGDLKETPGTRKQCRIVACISTKIRAKRTALVLQTPARCPLVGRTPQGRAEGTWGPRRCTSPVRTGRTLSRRQADGKSLPGPC